MGLADFLQVTLFGLVWGGVYALMSGGLNLIFGVMRVLNVAHGELVMLGAFAAFWLFTLWGVNPVVAILIAGPGAALLGVLLHDLVAEPLIRTSRSVPDLERMTLIAFFGVILVLRDSALALFKPQFRAIEYLNKPVSLGPLSIAPSRLVVLGVAALITLGMFYLLHRTTLGKALRAVSQDRDAARLLGVSVRSINRWGFAIGSGLAGISGALLMMIYVISPSMGVGFTSKAFAISVLGRLGNNVGALVASLTLGLVEVYTSLVIGESYRDVVGYMLLVIVILWRFRNPFVRARGA